MSSEFVPEGYVSLSDALEAYCEAREPDAWNAARVTAIEREQLLNNLSARKRQSNGRFRDEHTRAQATVTRAILSIESRMRKQDELIAAGWRELRSHLLLGRIASFVLSNLDTAIDKRQWADATWDYAPHAVIGHNAWTKPQHPLLKREELEAVIEPQPRKMNGSTLASSTNPAVAPRVRTH